MSDLNDTGIAICIHLRCSFPPRKGISTCASVSIRFHIPTCILEYQDRSGVCEIATVLYKVELPFSLPLVLRPVLSYLARKLGPGSILHLLAPHLRRSITDVETLLPPGSCCNSIHLLIDPPRGSGVCPSERIHTAAHAPLHHHHSYKNAVLSLPLLRPRPTHPLAPLATMAYPAYDTYNPPLAYPRSVSFGQQYAAPHEYAYSDPMVTGAYGDVSCQWC